MRMTLDSLSTNNFARVILIFAKNDEGGICKREDIKMYICCFHIYKDIKMVLVILFDSFFLMKFVFVFGRFNC